MKHLSCNMFHRCVPHLKVQCYEQMLHSAVLLCVNFSHLVTLMRTATRFVKALCCGIMFHVCNHLRTDVVWMLWYKLVYIQMGRCWSGWRFYPTELCKSSMLDKCRKLVKVLIHFHTFSSGLTYRSDIVKLAVAE